MVNVISSINHLMISSAESAAQTSIGQVCFRLTDKILWTIEKTSQWSLPETETRPAEENGKIFSKIELVRPLPWIIFLPTVLMVRIFRIGVNIAASILGYPKMEAVDMVNSIQKSRKRIRAIKNSGLKNMRLKNTPNSGRKDRTMTMKEASKSLAKSLRMTLSTLSCLDSGFKSPSPPPTKIRVSNILDTIEQEEIGTQLFSPKRKHSEIGIDDSSSDEEPILVKIDRFANMDGEEDDEDYVPPTDDNSESDSSDSEVDTSISSAEVEETLAEKEEMEKELGKLQPKRPENDDKNKNDNSSQKEQSETTENQVNQLHPKSLEKNHSTSINGNANSVDTQDKNEKTDPSKILFNGEIAKKN